MTPLRVAGPGHRDEPEQKGRRRDARDVEAQVHGAQQASEYVVDDEGEQEQRASQQEADTED